MKKLITICAAVGMILAAFPAQASVTLFENNETGWNTTVTTPITTINWDDVTVADGTSKTILGSRYSALAGSPTLSVDAGSGLYVINPSTSYFGTDFFPVSGENVFSPDSAGSPEGILMISFGTPVYALGAQFLDVEGDYAGTGIKVGGTLYPFSGNQGDNSQSFLGIVSSTPFTTVNIYMSANTGGNGVGIDDVKYAVVPAPAAILLSGIGVSLVGWLRRRRTF